jgi:hypothetical protein
MKRVITLAATIALVAGVADAASAKASHQKGYRGAHSALTQRNVRLRSQAPAAVPPANAELKYGPQPDYPQSPDSRGGF